MSHKKTTLLRGAAILVICLSCFQFGMNAQQIDTTTSHERYFRNTIKLNTTSNILYKSSIQVAYERVINKRQTLSIFGGYNEFPSSLRLDSSSLRLSGSQKKSGYSIGAEYRFYLAKENKYDAPHGVYIGPFTSYYRFNSERTITHTNPSGAQSSASLNMKISFLSLGGELGYQFVLGRFVIDAVLFGPSFTFYRFNGKLDGQLFMSEDDALNDIIEAIKEKIPLLDRLSEDKEVNSSGLETFSAIGFRYCINIGFRF